jgi:hypothetical protein
MSRVYSYKDYDKFLCLKVSSEMWLIMLYLLRPYILLISTLRLGRGGGNSKGISGLKDMVYPDDFSLALGIFATIPVLILMYGLMKRKPGAPDYVQKIWRHGTWLLIAAAVLNIVIVFVPLLLGLIAQIHPAGWVQVVLPLPIILYLYFSQRVKDTFADFPPETPADKERGIPG